MSFAMYVLLLLLLTQSVLGDLVYLDNGVIQVGVNPARGGSLSYLSQSGLNYSVINAHDMGREIQLSYYAGPNPYNPQNRCDTVWGPWSWNPIGAGDVEGNSGAVLNVTSNATYAEVLTLPLQWACNDVPCECTFLQQVSLAEGATWVDAIATIKNDRSDHTDYGAVSQEVPATYAIGDLSQLVSYRGAAPWTNAPVEEIATPQPQPPWNPNIVTVTENWAAFVNPQTSWGMGIYSPSFSSFNMGFHGTPGGGPTDDSTGYIAPIAVMDLLWNIEWSYKFSVVLGNLDTIRSFAYQQHAAALGKRQGAPFADFSNAVMRHSWVLAADDGGGVSQQQGVVVRSDGAMREGEQLTLTLSAQRQPSEGMTTTKKKKNSSTLTPPQWPSPSLLSPISAWTAGEVPSVTLRMSHSAALLPAAARLCVLPFLDTATMTQTVPMVPVEGHPSARGELPFLRAQSGRFRYANVFRDEWCIVFELKGRQHANDVANDGDDAWEDYDVDLTALPIYREDLTATFLQLRLDVLRGETEATPLASSGGEAAAVNQTGTVKIAWIKY